jgi:hypothetical protein
MAIPEVTLTIEDGALGTLPPNVAGASVKVGICSKGTPNVLTGFSDIRTMQDALGEGPLVEAIAQVLAVAGGPVYACPATPTVAGAAGSVTHGGTGVGTVAVAIAPDRTILAKITTGGVLATSQVAFSVDGGAYSTPVATAATKLVPGTLTTISMAAGTYVLNEVYTISTAGVVTQSGAGPVVTQASSPVDVLNVLIDITTGGALGTAVFTYSLDGGNSTSPPIATPGGGVYTIPGTGVVLTFAGAFTADDTYTFVTTAAGFTTSEVTTALTAIMADPTEWGFVHIVGAPANAAAAATLATTVDTKMGAAETAFRYAFGIVECPTSEADSALISAFAAFSSSRVMVCAGDVGMQSQLTGLIQRRNCAWAVSARLALIPAGQDPAWVGKGKVAAVSSLYRNEANTEALDAQRFTTMRTHIGKQGYFITNGRMMAAAGSDFTYVQFRRVMDRACQVVRAAELPYLNSDVRIDPATGYIDERDAQTFEGNVNAQLRTAVVSTGDASSSSVVMSRTTNLLSGSAQPVTVRVLSKAYLKAIDTSIGFTNPALSVAA